MIGMKISVVPLATFFFYNFNTGTHAAMAHLKITFSEFLDFFKVAKGSTVFLPISLPKEFANN
jgi:hypothetical protein